ncbi:hypothetical protein E1264_36520 [Actinomadura sp. KC216]|uniref:helix-turn-helix domain-containing protein n=1 Tax=Actinomadura sp. KC216 TaxID=2530370 RepID=UPI0010487795|nr:hypothetical protein [Actinomadura sp. KC216]TDB78745.1 hypothetical protein E1264_36520 [Actinomadura sp. KC216]
MAKPVHAAEKAQFVELFAAGHTIAQIAQDLERSPQTVQEHLAAAGKIDRKPPRGVTAEQIKAVTAAYVNDRLSMRRCAAEFGMPVGTVRRTLLFAGVPLTPPVSAAGHLITGHAVHHHRSPAIDPPAGAGRSVGSRSPGIHPVRAGCRPPGRGPTAQQRPLDQHFGEALRNFAATGNGPYHPRDQHANRRPSPGTGRPTPGLDASQSPAVERLLTAPTDELGSCTGLLPCDLARLRVWLTALAAAMRRYRCPLARRVRRVRARR